MLGSFTSVFAWRFADDLQEGALEATLGGVAALDGDIDNS